MDIRYGNKELYVLTSDVENPSYDGRRRGHAGKKVFQKGTLLFKQTNVYDFSMEEDNKRGAVENTTFTVVGDSSLTFDSRSNYDAYRTILVAAKPVAPSATKVILENDLHEYSLSVIMMMLVQQGYLSLQALEKVTAEFLNDDEGKTTGIEVKDREPVVEYCLTGEKV